MSETGRGVEADEFFREFEDALDDEQTLSKTVGYAKKLLLVLEDAGLPCDLDRIDDLVSDAITKTLEGTRTWDPRRVSLSTHLCGEIKSRVSKEVRRAESFREESLPEEEDVPLGEAFVFPTSPEWQVEVAEQLQLVNEALFGLCRQKNDEQVRSLLLAYAEGLTGRTELSIETGMKVDEVTNARKRLDRMIGDLPPELLPESREGR